MWSAIDKLSPVSYICKIIIYFTKTLESAAVLCWAMPTFQVPY